MERELLRVRDATTHCTGQIQGAAPDLMQRAREITGVDIVDSSIEEALGRLVTSLNQEAGLTEEGAEAITARLLRLLCNRLRMLRDFRDHPEIGEQRIDRPVILTGGPRTGSTKLHKLLAATGDFRFLPFWRGHCLSPYIDIDEDPTRRIADATRYIEWLAEHAPQAQTNHAYGTFEPEEEALILEHFICSSFPGVFAYIPSFMDWYVTQDVGAQLAFLKTGLQYIQWQSRDTVPRPWILKCPTYVGLEGRLADIFQDATFVTTNRDPVVTVPSTVNLVQGYQAAHSDVDRRLALGRAFLAGLSSAVQKHLSLRDRRPDLRFYDVAYGELAAAPESVIEGVYAHAGMTLTETARRHVRAWEAEHGDYRQTASRYTPADFGLSREEIVAAFQDYIVRFSGHF